MKTTMILGLVLMGCSGAAESPLATDAGSGAACSAEGQQICGGACVQTRSDGLHCGGCNNSCPGGLVCRAGVCSDPMTMIMCEGEGRAICNDVCIDISANTTNCGACGRQCAAGENCTNGRCAGDPVCTGLGEQMCGGQCVNVNNDARHCGGCNTACSGDARCSEGTCACGVGLTYCAGECVNTQRDVRHCGACLDPCSPGFDCRGGQCVQETDEICDGQDNDLDGRVDEGEKGEPLARVCDNLCGAGSEACVDGRYGECDAPDPAPEICDEVDNDCDGFTDEDVSTTYYEDFDGDGFGDPNLQFATQACALPEEASPNGGVYVANGDDCADVDEDIHPDAEEVCDRRDNNCDGDIDESCACAPLGGSRACGPDVGICVPGTQECTDAGWGECAGPDMVPPNPRELCNALDDDCDGMVDEALAGDGFEPNDACEMAHRLPDVREGAGAVRATDITLYHGGDHEPGRDVDWFIYTNREAVHVDCFERLLEPQCNFYYEAGLRVPDGADPDAYVMCMYENGCGGARFCTDNPRGARYDAPNRMWIISLNGPGTCGLQDNKTFAVEVRYVGREEPNACETYQLALGFAFQEQECAQ